MKRKYFFLFNTVVWLSKLLRWGLSGRLRGLKGSRDILVTWARSGTLLPCHMSPVAQTTASPVWVYMWQGLATAAGEVQRVSLVSMPASSEQNSGRTESCSPRIENKAKSLRVALPWTNPSCSDFYIFLPGHQLSDGNDFHPLADVSWFWTLIQSMS